MGLSPEEEAAFAAIAYDFEGRGRAGIPWAAVSVGVAVVGVGVLGAWMSGVPGAVLGTFCLAFTVALAAGLLCLALADRRKRRLALLQRGRRRGADARRARR